MAIYRFKVTFEDYDEVVREIDIKSTQRFEDLHKAIHRSTGYDVEKSSSFYVSTDHWIKGDEIAYLPNQRKVDRGVSLMENVKLSSLIDDPHQKFYYIYNFDRPYDFHVELIKIILDTDPNIQYPFVSKSTGEAPKIFDKNNMSSIAAAAAPAASEFDFLNELDVVPEDTEELEALGGTGINEKEQADDDDEEKDEDAFTDDEDYEDEGYGGKDDDY